MTKTASQKKRTTRNKPGISPADIGGKNMITTYKGMQNALAENGFIKNHGCFLSTGDYVWTVARLDADSRIKAQILNECTAYISAPGCEAIKCHSKKDISRAVWSFIGELNQPEVRVIRVAR